MLKATNIAKNFETRLLFKNVNFEILPQSIHLLQGANGAGKSTLFKIILGLLEQDHGEIVTALKHKDVGYIAHALFQYPQFTALENLKFWHNLHTQKTCKDEEYIAILEKVGLALFAHEEVRIFSRGMKQKLNIARLLVQEAKLYLLDEPTTGLDVEARNFLISHILEAKQNGASVFWISHDIENDKKHADFLHILEDKTLKTSILKGDK